MNIKFTNMYQQYEEREKNVMKYERRHISQVPSLGNYVDDTPTETSLMTLANP